MAEQKKSKKEFLSKIKTVEELREILGGPPRKETVVMCHGTFDIVHPGHLRHLQYAKDRADILVASLTCDEHIRKANYRPYVPQQLRAENLAALEFVDYVLIDHNDIPLENLGRLKPDFFAKGFDYFQQGIPPKTQDEIKVLESYGGEVIFTPGDIVYSSSALIEEAPPKLAALKLHMLMQSENVGFNDLRQALRGFEGVKVHVLGDTIVDSYSYCHMIGGMTKTPTISVQFEKEINFAGGAAVVSKHLRRAGAEVKFSTVLGNDNLKDFVIKDLEENGIEVDAVIDKTRPTTNKNTFLCKGHHLLRMNKLDNRIISGKICKHFSDSLAASNADAFIFSDYRHGIFSRNTISTLSESLPKGAFRVADSQVASRWGNILEFQNFDLIKPNEREARFALGDQDSVIRPLAMELFNRAHCKCLMLTLGERGLITYKSGDPNVRSFFTVDSFADRVVDAVGSGDALLSYATLALLTTKNQLIASVLGSFAAAIACSKEGNYPVTCDEMFTKIDEVEKQVGYLMVSAGNILNLS